MTTMDVELAELSRSIDAGELGRRLKNARIAAGLTQADVAGDEVTAAYVSRIEDGQRRPGAALLESMVARMNVSLDQVLRGVSADERLERDLSATLAELTRRHVGPNEALANIEGLVANLPNIGFERVRARASRTRAAALVDLGDINAAINVLEELIEGPTDGSTLDDAITLARCSATLGDPAHAISVAEPLLPYLASVGLSNSPEALEAAAIAADARARTADVDAAIEICRTQGELSDSLSRDYFDAASAEAERGAVASAAAFANKALHSSSDSRSARASVAFRTTYANLLLQVTPADPKTAKAVLRSSGGLPADTDPISRRAYSLALGRAHLLLGELDEAGSLADAASALSSDAPRDYARANIVLGQVAAAQEDTASAKRYFKTAAKSLEGSGKDRDTAQLWLELGTVLTEVGDKNGALSAFQNAATSSGLTAVQTTRSTSTVPAR